MDSAEGRFLVGFILMGIAPLFVSSGVGLVGAIIFIVGLLISSSSAFA